MSFLETIFGNTSKRFIGSLSKKVEAINLMEPEFAKISDKELRSRFLALRDLYIQKHISLDNLLVEAFALVREASKRTLKQRHYDVQLIGGMVLHQGRIAEMRTGEGKTLVATLAVSLNALTGKGAHVITVNDYLARRDAQWMGQIYNFLGLSIGVIQHESAYQYSEQNTGVEGYEHLKQVERKIAYACDVTYGTNNEFGFDYLRDNMAPTLEHKVQRELHYAIIDEVDSILIDEARTPLIISAPSSDSSEKYNEFARHVRQLHEGEHYNVDEKMRAVTLTEEGIKKMETILHVDNIYTAGGIESIHHIEQSLRAQALFKLDKDYVVKDGEVVIVDEFTGRLMFGRRYSEGLHQALEAKEGVAVQQENQTLATITFQNLFRLYKKISGMTGTAATESEEFNKIYGLEVVVIPTNKPIDRTDLADRIYKTEKGKFEAVVREIKLRQEHGQPVLLGTISIEKNEVLSELLNREGIQHEILNAKNHAREAQIIENAGKKSAVTLATNMAGRGVDIILGGKNATFEEHAEVKSLGGLHVIGTERHESRRIDNQLRGRSGRQGDPGSSQFYVSTEDDLMRIFGSDRMKSLMERLGVPDDMPIENKLISRSIETAQKKVEGHNFDIRKHLVEYDDVINKHREIIYKKRNEILSSVTRPEGMREKVRQLVYDEIERVIQFHSSSEIIQEWNLDEIYEVMDTIFPVHIKTRMSLEDIIRDSGVHDAPIAHIARNALIEYCRKLIDEAYTNFEKSNGDTEQVRRIERAVYLRSIDSLWVEHLSLMDYLRQGIGLRGYGQRDPLVEYKKESFRLFNELLQNVRHQVVYTIFKINLGPTQTVTSPANQSLVYKAPIKDSSSSSSSGQFAGFMQQASASHPQGTSSMPAQVVTKPDTSRTPNGEKIGRNDPCWCGSGKKFKKCHGA
ncbi:MAG: preprotein translocase subunit SecA [Patescibacteria group bacterium]